MSLAKRLVKLPPYGDFALDVFDRRNSPAAFEKFMKDYIERSEKEVEALKPYEETKRYRF